MKLSNPTLAARLASPEDETFLLSLYHHGRAAELAMFGFNAEQERGFVQMQFRARTMHYANAFPDAQDFIITQANEAIGRVLLNEIPGFITIVDMALLPAHCGRGLGAGILGDVIQRADAQLCVIDLHVEYSSRAKALYQRLGFDVTADSPPYFQMMRQPTAQR